MDELATRLPARRAALVETMANALAADGDWHCWLPLLTQLEVSIQAVEAVKEDAPERVVDLTFQ